MKQTDGGDRLKLKSEFDFVKANGQKLTTSLFVMLVVPGSEDHPGLKCGVICSRRFDKRAVVRNRARRIILEAFRLSKQGILPCTMILIPRRLICGVKMDAVKKQMTFALQKFHLMDTSQTFNSPSPSGESC